MKLGSLFSGIGGIDLGLERAGMEVVWQVEVDPYCQKVLAKHWPEVPCYGDIKEIDFTKLPAVDLICGGFPCQPVSCAGKRQGDKDERWLWPEYLRAIQQIRPKWILGENVPGILSTSNGRLFGGILRDLAVSGYDAEWDCIPAAAFGAPHLRYRTFIVAYPSKNRQKYEIFNNGILSKTTYKGWTNSTFTDMDTWNRPETPPPSDLRMAYGLPDAVDRFACLGNAVVPQVAEWIGRRIMEAEATL